MRKFRYLLGTCIVGIVALTTSAFAYFNFSSNSSTDTSANAYDGDYVNNIEFDSNSTEDSDRTYTLYFFASPYYACGTTETIDENTNALTQLEDPLTIAESDKNPYIDSTEYCITSYTALTGDDTKYANYVDSNGNHRYISTPSYDATKGTKLSTVTKMHTKADFYGTLSITDEAKTTKGTVYNNNYHTYFKLQVKDSILNDVLKGITCTTEFKNRYGWSPEFMGWTYNKQECFKRVTYSAFDSSYHRYYNNTYLNGYSSLQMNSVTTDNDGNVTINNDNPDQIGNYGANSYIPILSAEDSLYGIDNNADDGSESNDKVIYLYPVFGDRTISTSTSVTKAPILKMLSNPDTDETSNTYYKYHQEGENDYQVHGLNTTYRRSDFLNYDSSVTVTEGTTVTEPNYTIKNFFVDQVKDGNNFLNNYSLEVLTVNNYEYSSSWTELFNNTKLIDLFNFDDSDSTKNTYFQNYVNTYYGTFDIDIILSQQEFTFNGFENNELYINSPNSKSIKKVTSSDGITVYYVIGLKRNNSLRLTGLNNTSILSYESGNKSNINSFTKTSIIYTEGENKSYWHYYTCKPFTVSSSEISKYVSVMIKESLSLFVDSSTNTYNSESSKSGCGFKAITSGVLDYFNEKVSESNLKNKVNFISAGKKQDIHAYLNSDATTGTKSGETDTTTIYNFPTIQIKKEGTYELLAAVKYSNGFPSDIQIGFREYSEVCNLLVLKEKPTSTLTKYSNDTYLYSDIATNQKNLILLESEFSIGETIKRSTKFASTQFKEILDDSTYKNKELYDLATGEPVKDLINNGSFILSRNMILYFGDSSSS